MTTFKQTNKRIQLTRVLLVPFLFVLLMSACIQKQEHLIGDSFLREQVDSQFNRQKELAKDRSSQLFDVFNQELTVQEIEALKFLFAYMPLNDLADYDGQYFLNNVRKALEARRTLSWGSRVPVSLFLHFVLPHRVNNENLDNFRSKYFDELKNRVHKLSMKQAVLEVNHWCHEKVEYKSTDIRTSSPANTIRTAFGRCGEESTLTVSALRAVGIPARQCYTPRWAHCDDNHAWVEVWVNGKWYYLGACEPEPALNTAWFTEPARRAMLVHTKVYGRYNGPENVIHQRPLYSEINILDNYAKTQPLKIQVLDPDNSPVADAVVAFKVYNFAEFFPIAQKRTDSNGQCTLAVGLGDLLIWASKGPQFGFQKISAAGIDSLTIVLDKTPGNEYTLNYDIIPPIQPTPFPVSSKGKEENSIRLKQEDRIRADYVSTFIDSDAAYRLAEKLDFDPETTWAFLKKSRGNWKAVSEFLDSAARKNKNWALTFLGVLSEKDLRDTRAGVLTGQFNHSFRYAGDLPDTDPELFTRYILNPRISNEIIVNYKGFLQNQFTPTFINKCKQDIDILIQWIREQISIQESHNYYSVPITPIGVFQLKLSDMSSRDIFFVGISRSFGIPARLDPVYKRPQYFDGTVWQDVNFDGTAVPLSNGAVQLVYSSGSNSLIPEYHIHFSLARFNNGEFVTLDYGYNTKLNVMPDVLKVQQGYYLLITGTRLEDGSSLCRLTFFNVPEGTEPVRIPLEFRQSEIKPVIRGTVPLNTPVSSLTETLTTGIKLSNLAKHKGVILGWLEPGTEPSKHVMQEIGLNKQAFNEWGGSFVFFIMSDKVTASVAKRQFTSLPDRHIFSIDEKSSLLQAISRSVKRPLGASLPIFMVVKPSGKIIRLTEGYRIGIGELLLKTVLY
jgi:hypothetical protein